MGMSNGFHRKKIIQCIENKQGNCDRILIDVDFFNGRGFKNDLISKPKNKPEEEEKKMNNPNIFAYEQEEDGNFPIISNFEFIIEEENQNAIRIVRHKKKSNIQQGKEINDEPPIKSIYNNNYRNHPIFEEQPKQQSSLYQSAVGPNLSKQHFQTKGSKEEGDSLHDYAQPNPRSQIQPPLDKTMKFNKVNKKPDMVANVPREERNLQPNYEQPRSQMMQPMEEQTKKYKKNKNPEFLNMIAEADDPTSEYTSGMNFEENPLQINHNQNNQRREKQANVGARNNGMPLIEEEENSIERRSIQPTKKYCHKLIVQLRLKNNKHIDDAFFEDFSIGTDKANGLALAVNPQIGVFQDIGETHCLVKINQKGIFELEDCGGEFGTFYKLNSDQKYLLEEGQIYQIGQTLIKIKAIDEKMSFEVLEGKNAGDIIEVDEKQFTFGSKKKNNFYLKNDKLVSEMHCYFKKKESGGFSIIDNSSTNG